MALPKQLTAVSDAIKYTTVLKRGCRIAKSYSQCRHVCLPLCPLRAQILLLVDVFSWNVIFDYSSKICTGRTAHRGSRGIALLFLDHGTRRRWGVSVTPRPLFTPGKDSVLIVQEAGWAPGPVWTGAENLAPPGFDPRNVQPVASRYTDWATGPTMICRDPTKITGTFPENLHKFRITSRSILITMTNVEDKRRENQNTYFMFNDFFKENSGVYEIM